MKEFNEFREYLLENNILVRDSYFKYEKPITKEDILHQIRVINQFQKVAMRFHSRKTRGVLSILGKDLERYKNLVKILKRDINEYNDMGKIAINKGFEILKKLEEIDYDSILKRAMLRDEVSAGKVGFSNLRVVDEIEFGKIKKLNFNNVEEDFIEFLREYKSDIVRINLDEIIEEYVNLAKLNNMSKTYINALVEMPLETLKYLKRSEGNIENEVLFELMKREWCI